MQAKGTRERYKRKRTNTWLIEAPTKAQDRAIQERTGQVFTQELVDVPEAHLLQVCSKQQGQRYRRLLTIRRSGITRTRSGTAHGSCVGD